MIKGPSKELWRLAKDYFKHNPDKQKAKIKEEENLAFSFHLVKQTLYRAKDFLNEGFGLTAKVKTIENEDGAEIVVKTTGGKIQHNEQYQFRHSTVNEEKEAMERLGILLDVHERSLVAPKPLINAKSRAILFDREAKTLAMLGLDEGFIAKNASVYNETVSDKRTDYFMPKYEGQSLHTLFQQIVTKKLTLSPLQLNNIALECIKAVLKLHEKRVIHCDLKMEHFIVLLKPDGTCEVNIIDFGFALLLDHPEDERTIDIVRGSPDYEAPECMLKRYSAKSDIFALGKTLASFIPTGRNVIKVCATKMCYKDAKKRLPLKAAIALLEKDIALLQPVNHKPESDIRDVEHNKRKFSQAC